MRFIFVVLTVVALSGCGGVPLEKQAVSIQDDQFSQKATVLGTKLFDNSSGGPFKEWFIRSFIDKANENVSHELYVYTHYLGDWHFYQSAADDTAAPLTLVSIDQKVGDCQGICDFDETFALLLSDTTLRARATTGLRVKVSARDGTAFVIPILPGQINPQLAAVESYREAHQSFRNPDNATTASTSAMAPPGTSAPVIIGIRAIPTPAPIANIYKITGGLYVISVTSGSVADHAGIKTGDVILRYGDKAVNTIDEIQAAIASTHVGAKVDLDIRRGQDTDLLHAQF